MSRSLATKAALVIGLAVAAAFPLLAPAEPAIDRIQWITAGILAFGVFNVLVDPKGTFRVRTVAIIFTFLALATGQAASMFMLLLAWLIWPPAFLVAWTLNSDRSEQDAPQDALMATNAKITAAAIIAMVAVAAFLFRMLSTTTLQQSAALFVGLPAVLAIAAVFSPTPRSATGVACKAVTIGLLVSLIFLGEGMLCIAMSAPLFYLVAVIVGISTDRLRSRTNHQSRTLTSCVALLALVPMSLEGVTESMSFNRDMTVAETQIVHSSADAVARAIHETPRFDRALPYYLRAGFPRPSSSVIVGHPLTGAADSLWIIRMRGGEMRLNGMEPRAGDLVLALEEARPGLVQWRAVSDDSHMTHFLDWRSAQVKWEPIDAQTTRVTWTLRYHRRLDPAWYFGPMEEHAARLAAGYLIEAVATP
jgi:hypothetical protein